MQIKNNSFCLNQVSCDYLSSCDLINKYCLKSVYKTPKVKQITLTFSLKNFISGVEKLGSTSGKNSTLLEIKAYLVLYLYFCNLPFLSFNLTSTNRSLDKSDNGDFVFKSIISSKKDINDFLFKVWVDSFNRLKINSCSLKYTSAQTCYSLSLSTKSLVDFEDIVSILNQDFDSKDFDINLYFVFANVDKNKNTDLLIKNVLCFG